jgi:hypothetical protein
MRRIFNWIENWFMGMKQERRALCAFLITLFNGYCIFRVDIRTLVPFLGWLFLLIAVVWLGYALSKKFMQQDFVNYRHFVAWILFPASIHFLFVLNYFVSFNNSQESYRCYQGTQVEFRKGGGGSHTYMNTMIYLEDGAYEKYPGIRVFVDRSQIKGSYITYTFATGMFGMRVMKDWEFSSEEDPFRY